MASFYRFETTALTLKFTPEGILDDYKHIVVSISQTDNQLDLSENNLSIDELNDSITFSLSQEQTSQFRVGRAEIQVNIYYNDTNRNVSTKGYIEVYDNLYNKVMNNE